MSTSLIPPESLARVGEILSEPVTVLIDQREAQRYAYAVGDLNPIYFDEGSAQAAGYHSITVPPLFITHALVRPKPADELRLDGLYEDTAALRRVHRACLLYTSPSPRDAHESRMPSSA